MLLNSALISLFLSTPSARRATYHIFFLLSRVFYFYPRPPRGGRRRRSRNRRSPKKFLSTPSARRATGPNQRPAAHRRISIHALREEGDANIGEQAILNKISIHALREEGDSSKTRQCPTTQQFLSTPSARRATNSWHWVLQKAKISIHALREEGDGMGLLRCRCFVYFYPRPPRGGRQKHSSWRRQKRYFYPRPPRGGRHVTIEQQGKIKEFLSTPSARRATLQVSVASRFGFYFYPRPPRGGRHECFKRRIKPNVFLSTPSARRATGGGQFYATTDQFLSTPSARRATRPRPAVGSDFLIFLSTPSARRATAKTETKSLFSNKLYNILHEFRRALIYNGSKNYPNHAK